MSSGISKEQQDLVNDMMFKALNANDWKRFQLCVSKGADLQAKDNGGRTPLMKAARACMSDTWMEFMLKNQPDFFAKDQEGLTVFDLAGAIEVHYYGEDNKKRIMDLLLNALPSPSENATPENSSKKDDFNAAGLSHNLRVGKPIVLRPSEKSDTKFTQ